MESQAGLQHGSAGTSFKLEEYVNFSLSYGQVITPQAATQHTSTELLTMLFALFAVASWALEGEHVLSQQASVD